MNKWNLREAIPFHQDQNQTPILVFGWTPHICLTTVPDCSDRLVLFLVLDVDSKIRHHDDLMIKVCKFESQMVRINEARND